MSLIPALFLFASGVIPFVHAQETTPPPELESFKDKKTKEGFVLNLKDLIKQSKDKIKKVDGKLKEQARERRNQQREEKARAYYEKGMRLYEQEKFDEAAEYWEKAVKITEHPEMEGYISKSVKRTKQEQKLLAEEEKKRLKRLEVERGYSAKEVEKKYAKGVEAYKKEKYLDAKLAFEEVDVMFPDHKATRSYLMLIDRMIDDDQKAVIEKKLQQGIMAKSKDKKEAWKKELEQKEQERENNLENQAEELYQEGVRYYKEKQFELAREKFKEVEWVLPNYKKTLSYLSKLDKNVEKDGVYFTNEEKLEYFEKEVREEKKHGPSVVSSADDGQDKPWWQLWGSGSGEGSHLSPEQRAKREDEAAILYKSAVDLFKQEYYAQAQAKFLQIQDLLPNFRSTNAYLKKISKVLPKNELEIARQRERIKDEKENVYQAPQSKEDLIIAKAIEERNSRQLLQADIKYSEALKFYAQGELVEAQRKFIAVEALYPDFKETRSYLSRIDEEINKSNLFGEQYVNVQDLGVSLTDKNTQQEVSADLEQEAKQKYEQAVALYKANRFVEAEESFQVVDRLVPGYKATEDYLLNINRATGKVTKVSRGEYVGSEKSTTEHELTKVQKGGFFSRLFGSKKNSRTLTREQRKELRSNQSVINRMEADNTREEKKELRDEVEVTYSDALALYGDERYLAAQAKFSSVEQLHPGYRSAKSYIKKIDRILAKRGDYLDREKISRKEKDKEPLIEAKKETVKHKESVGDNLPAMQQSPQVSQEKYDDALAKERLADDQQRETAKAERLERRKEEEMDRLQQEKEFMVVKLEQDKALNKMKLENAELESASEKEKENLKQDQFKLEQRRRLEDEKDTKRELDDMFREAVSLYRVNQLVMAKEKLAEYESRLDLSGLPMDYINKNREKAKQYSYKVDVKMEKDRQKQIKYGDTIGDQVERDKQKQLVETKSELAALEKKIKDQEDQLAAEVAVPVFEKSKAAQPSQAKTRQIADEIDTKFSFEEKQRGIDQLVKLRRKELQVERARIRREYDEGLQRFYDRAVNVYQNGYTEDAHQMFSEIEHLEPDYKKTRSFLANLERELGMPPTMDYVRNTYDQPSTPKGRTSVIKQALDAFEKNLW